MKEMYAKILEIWKSYNINKSSDLEKYLYNFKILFAYHSGKIENAEINYYDTREVFENGRVCSFTGNVRTLFEQQNQKDCYEILKDKIEDAENDLQELIDDINNHEIGDKLKIAAYFHANFENIHPFADGNGRVGRTLLNYYLMLNNHPPIIIYDEDKIKYYETLNVFDEKLIIDDLYIFLKNACVKTWRKNVR